MGEGNIPLLFYLIITHPALPEFINKMTGPSTLLQTSFTFTT